MVTRYRVAGRFLNRGLTLVEVMVSVALLTFFTTTLVTSLLKAYQLSAVVRARDQARFVITSASDQFLRGTYLLGDNITVRTFFVPTTSPTGVGMAWQKDLQVFAFPPGTADPSYVVGTSAGLPISLAQDSGASTSAVLTRQVAIIDPSTGSASPVAATPAGQVLQATFIVTFTFGGKSYVETSTVVRTVP